MFEDLLKYDSKYQNIKYEVLASSDNEESIIIFLSDLHIGAYNEKFGFYELPNYDKKEI